jgi:MYXO-CTERM domain-containing protein
MGAVCTDYGPKKGTCVSPSCYSNPCLGCDKVCNLGACVDNPCKPDTCKPDEACKPTSDFTSHTCVKPCGDLVCPGGQACSDGVCVQGCSPACGPGQACDLGQDPPTCGPDKCQPNPCTDGSFCDPVTGQCGNDPCTGVLCPGDLECSAGQCVRKAVSSSSSSSGGGSSGGGSGGAGGATPKGVWGLATGGGGCSCEAGPGAMRAGGAWALVALAVAMARRRRKRT